MSERFASEPVMTLPQVAGMEGGENKMTPDERTRVEGLKAVYQRFSGLNVPDAAWLLDLVERQDGEIQRLTTHTHTWTASGECACGSYRVGAR